MKKTNVVLVDEKDNQIGLEEKIKAHLEKGRLHRAFMIFIFNEKGELLLQKRSKNKMLWPLYWDCTCASHPFEKEEYIEAGKRRLKEELGFSCSLSYLTKFCYQAEYKKVGSENEICALLIGSYSSIIKENPEEVEEIKWISLPELRKKINNNPADFTPWLKIGFEIYEQTRNFK